MNALTKMRNTLITFYNKGNSFILPICKFVLAFGLFYLIGENYGFMPQINQMFIIVILAAACAFLPINGTAIIAMLLLVINCFGLGVIVGIFALCLYLLMLILILRFTRNDMIAVVLAPFAFMLNLAPVIPLCLGLSKKVVSALSAICIVVAVYFTKSLPVIEKLQHSEDISSLELLKEMIGGIVDNQELLVTTIIFVAVVLVVCIIRKFCTTFGWLFSVIVGSAAYLVLTYIGRTIFSLSTDLPMLVLSVLLSMAITLVITFFFVNVDYKGSEYMQFEDEDYYYYVKAIPKRKVVVTEEEDEDEEDEEETAEEK